MSKKKVYDDDDGRTIVDMSEVDPMPMLLPRFKRGEQEQSPTSQQFSKEDRRAILFGSVGAALLIGAIFVAAAAIVICLMLFAWT
jgi:hypothetical protein